MEYFAVYRSYFWQVTAIGTLALVARHVAATKADLDWRRDLDMAAIAVLATAASIGVHYIGALFGGLLASAIAVCAFTRGLRRWAALVLATTALSSLFVLASVALQMPSWAAEFDHIWIDLPGFAALGVRPRSPSHRSGSIPCRWLAFGRAGGQPGVGHTRRFADLVRRHGRRRAGRGHGRCARQSCVPADRGRALSLRRPGAGERAAGRAGGEDPHGIDGCSACWRWWRWRARPGR